MFEFVKKLFGKKTTSNKCCGNGSCHSASSTQKDLILTDHDMEVLNRLDARIVVGKVESLESHSDPKVTKVRVSQTNIGGGKVEQILCGGTNLVIGDIVAVATVGARLSEDFEIGVREIRGQESRGMICARAELGLSLAGEEKGCIWKLPAEYEMVLGKKLVDL